MKTEYVGTIPLVRDVEDSIRATKKYTKGAFTSPHKRLPVQGSELPSRVLTEYYEVYPDVDVSWDMSANDAWAWVWGDVLHVDVLFKYNYPANKAWITIHGGNGVILKLVKEIPGFGDALDKVVSTRIVPTTQEAVVHEHSPA